MIRRAAAGPLAVWTLAAVCALTLAPGPARAQDVGAGRGDPALTEPVDRSATAPLRLVGQSGPVTGSGVFSLRVAVGSTGPEATLLVNLYDRLTSRSAFHTSLTGIPVGQALASTTPRPLAEFDRDPAGVVEHSFDLNDGSLPRAEGQVRLTREGVYPVVVELRDRSGETVDRLVTHLVRLPDPGSVTADQLAPLAVGWVAEVGAGPLLRPDGTRGLGRAERERLTTIIDALARHPEVAVTVIPTPETLAGLVTSPDPTERAIGRRLVARLEPDATLATEYVTVRRSELIDLGLRDDADTLLAAGRGVLDELVGGSRRVTWVAPAGARTDELLARYDTGVREVVVPADQVTDRSEPPTITVARPFELDLGEETVAAVVVDPALQRHFSTADPVLGAHQLLAELSILQYDLPSVARGVVVRPPTGWDPNPAFLDIALAGLSRSPLLDDVVVQDLFDLDADTDSDGQPVRRDHVGGRGRAFRGDLDLYDLTLERLAGVRSMIADDEGAAELEDLLVRMAPSLSFDLTEAGHAAYWNQVRARADDLIDGIDAPPAQTFTLTAREDELPLRFRNDGPIPLQVRVRVESEKLTLPDGRDRVVVLGAGEVVDESFRVDVRATGSFPVTVKLASPDGRIPITESRVTVRSLVLSGLGVILSVAALALLVLWWGLHIRRTRRTGTAA